MNETLSPTEPVRPRDLREGDVLVLDTLDSDLRMTTEEQELASVEAVQNGRRYRLTFRSGEHQMARSTATLQRLRRA